ncbi:MAG: IS4 family transposase [Acidobacteriota bacterium]|nr:IS4 family transposase [Acidobacteriota bacterium]
MKTETKQTPDALEEALKQSIQGTRHARKFVARFVAALVKVRSSNLVKVANAVETEAEADSVYRQIQRFLDNDNKVVIDYLKLMKLDGKLKILIDRTEWKFGDTWINILTLSVAYKNVAIPILCEVMEHKGNATALEHIAVIEKFVAEFGVGRIERVYADREFGSEELFKYLIGKRIDFHIRLKTGHLTGGVSFKKIWGNAAERVKLRGKVRVEVFGLEVYVSCIKYRKDGKTEYLIVASLEHNKYAIEEYKVRWQIETMFGCLKSRGFNFEETHLTMPKKIGKLLMLLGLGLCLAMLTGELQVEVLQRVKMKKKKNKRYAKSLFRIGLDTLQNALFNQNKPKKHRQLELFIDLLSCA